MYTAVDDEDDDDDDDDDDDVGNDDDGDDDDDAMTTTTTTTLTRLWTGGPAILVLRVSVLGKSPAGRLRPSAYQQPS